MTHRSYLNLLPLVFILLSCQADRNSSIPKTNKVSTPIKVEKLAILNVLNEETAAAFNRNYEEWQDKWVHEDYVSKTYMNFTDSTMSESLGWKEINDFVKTYIQEHPEPDPIPQPLDDIELRLYGSGAWVEYDQLHPTIGLKREGRLMEKDNGKWKIAGMQTVIYGFREDDSPSIH